MQLRHAGKRQGRMPIQLRLWRVVASLALALGISSVPIAQVAACSCATSTTEQAIAGAALAFTGTVADQRELGGRDDFGDELIEYAFLVDRATLATDPVTRVTAGTGGAMCGMTFANGEEWLILAHRSPAGLETHLCAGNLLMADIGPDERAAIDDLLLAGPRVTEADPVEPTASVGLPLPFLAGGAALVLLTIAGVLAFRGRPPAER